MRPSLVRAQDDRHVEGGIAVRRRKNVDAAGADGQRVVAIGVERHLIGRILNGDALDRHVRAKGRGGRGVRDRVGREEHIGASTGDQRLHRTAVGGGPVAVRGTVRGRPDLGDAGSGYASPIGGRQGCLAGDRHLQIEGIRAGKSTNGEISVVEDFAQSRSGGRIERTARAASDQGIGASRRDCSGDAEYVHGMGGVGDGRRASHVDRRTGQPGPDGTTDNGAGTASDGQRSADS